MPNAPYSSLRSPQNDTLESAVAASVVFQNNNDLVQPDTSAYTRLQQALQEVNAVQVGEPSVNTVPHKATVAPKAASKPAPKQAVHKATTSKPLSSRSSSSPIVAASSIGGAVAVYSERFIGVPYRWGGSTPRGFDCSGFTAYAFRQYGVSLSHSSYAQFGAGSYVSRGNLNAGDLVFFDTDGAGASHVGIYLGGGRFINAAGSSVRIDSLYSGYWGSHYLGARRVH